MCKLHKSIYGLKQAPYSWNRFFDKTIKTLDFDQNEDESCVYKKIQGSMVVFLLMYVDDILLIRNGVGLLSLVKIWLSTQFEKKDLGEVKYILGIKIFQDRKNTKIVVSQATYIDKLLVKYVMQDSKKGMLPFKNEVSISQDQCPKKTEEKDHMKAIPYASMVGSLMYVMLCTRPDICFVVGMMSRYQSNPYMEHWTMVKHTLKHIRRTRDYMLVYHYDGLLPF